MSTAEPGPDLPWEVRPPSARADMVRTLVIGVLVALTLIGEWSSGRLQPLPDIGLGLAGVVLVLWLSRRPVSVAVVLALLALGSPALVPSSTGATYYVARTRSAPVAVAVAALAALTHALRVLWRPFGELPFGWWVVVVLAVHAALLASGALGRSRAQVMAALLERAERAEAERDAREREARAQERAAIAREMHDVLAHRLSLVATYSGALEVHPDAPPDQLTRAVSVVRQQVHTALDELREIIGVLRQDMPDGQPLRPQPGLADLPDLVADSAAAGVEVDLSTEIPDADTVPGTVARTVYRVVQEALTNVRRHAPGSPAQVTVTGSPGTGLEVTVTNPLGRGGGAGPSGAASGLIGLSERVALAGGSLEHGVVSDEFRVSARLPWPP